MTLPAPDLDDRRFQDIVDEAKRLLPVWCPEWTNHNVSDPGVALIELFAWMTDLLLYRVNQVPDRLYTKFLELVGIERFAAEPAMTELTFMLSALEAEPVTVAAGTEVATAATDGHPVVFTTDEDLHIAQPELVACVTSAGPERFVDRWDDLEYPRATVTCFGSDPLTPDDALYLGFAASLAGHLLRFEIDASVHGLGIDPDAPPLAWEVWDGSDWSAARVVTDTTGGLNTAGTIDLVLPLRHEAITVGGTRCWWVRARLLAPRPGQPTYESSPAIRSVVASTLGGTVRAHHGQAARSEPLGRSDGTPGQSFSCRFGPVLPRRPGETVVVTTVIGPEVWTEVADFSRSGPSDRHFTWESSTGAISFGPAVRQPDGRLVQYGAVPADGADVAVAGYRYGGGAAGNVGPGTLTVLRTTIPYIDRVINVGPAAGGIDPETVENAKLRGPLSLRTADRAVTAADFERLALDASPEVARATCLPPLSPGAPIRLFLVPRLDGPPEQLHASDLHLHDRLFERVRDHIEPRRIVGTGVEIGAPTCVGISVAAHMRARRSRNVELVRELALQTLHRYLHPTQGGDGGGWPFGALLTTASLFQLLGGIDGVEEVDEVLLFEADLQAGLRLGRGVDVVDPGPGAVFVSFSHRVVVR